jgi:stalled ribosome alternative rescue factor ArfA
MSKPKPPRRKPNPVARSLRSDALRPRVVKPKKGRGSYSRKGRKRGDQAPGG